MKSMSSTDEPNSDDYPTVRLPREHAEKSSQAHITQKISDVK